MNSGNSLYGLQFCLDSISVGFDHLCVDTGYRVHKEQQMIHSAVVQAGDIAFLIVGTPFTRVDHSAGLFFFLLFISGVSYSLH